MPPLPAASDPLQGWHWLTRLGEAQILLPAIAVTVIVLLSRPDARAHAGRWALLLGLAVLLTTASKIAFIGWGIGWAEIDYTGISGHAMFAAAVYPWVAITLASRASLAQRRLALGAGALLALLIGLSRVVVGAHSVSEVLAGLLIGGLAGAAALALLRLPPLPLKPLIPCAVLAWLAMMPFTLPSSPTHALVTQLSLKLSGHSTPYTRSDMLRELRQRRAAPLQAGPDWHSPVNRPSGDSAAGPARRPAAGMPA